MTLDTMKHPTLERSLRLFHAEQSAVLPAELRTALEDAILHLSAERPLTPAIRALVQRVLQFDLAQRVSHWNSWASACETVQSATLLVDQAALVLGSATAEASPMQRAWLALAERRAVPLYQAGARSTKAMSSGQALRSSSGPVSPNSATRST